MRDRLKMQFDQGDYTIRRKKKKIMQLFMKQTITSADLIVIINNLQYEEKEVEDHMWAIILRNKKKLHDRVGEIDESMYPHEHDRKDGLGHVVTAFLENLNMFIPQKYIFSSKLTAKKRWDIIVLGLAI